MVGHVLKHSDVVAVIAARPDGDRAENARGLSRARTRDARSRGLRQLAAVTKPCRTVDFVSNRIKRRSTLKTKGFNDTPKPPAAAPQQGHHGRLRKVCAAERGDLTRTPRRSLSVWSQQYTNESIITRTDSMDATTSYEIASTPMPAGRHPVPHCRAWPRQRGSSQPPGSSSRHRAASPAPPRTHSRVQGW